MVLFQIPNSEKLAHAILLASFGYWYGRIVYVDDVRYLPPHQGMLLNGRMSARVIETPTDRICYDHSRGLLPRWNVQLLSPESLSYTRDVDAPGRPYRPTWTHGPGLTRQFQTFGAKSCGVLGVSGDAEDW